MRERRSGHDDDDSGNGEELLAAARGQGVADCASVPGHPTTASGIGSPPPTPSASEPTPSPSLSGFGETEGDFIRWLSDAVRDAAPYELPVVAHIYPRDYSDGGGSSSPQRRSPTPFGLALRPGLTGSAATREMKACRDHCRLSGACGDGRRSVEPTWSVRSSRWPRVCGLVPGAPWSAATSGARTTRNTWRGPTPRSFMTASRRTRPSQAHDRRAGCLAHDHVAVTTPRGPPARDTSSIVRIDSVATLPTLSQRSPLSDIPPPTSPPSAHPRPVTRESPTWPRAASSRISFSDCQEPTPSKHT